MIDSFKRSRCIAGWITVAVCLASFSNIAALDWTASGPHRYAPVIPSGSGKTGFTMISPQDSGVLFTNSLAESQIATNRILENGSGVALGDVDGDGLCDIYLCSINGENRLYKNLGGFRFEDITTPAGVGCPGQHSTGAVFADVNGDGSLDLLVSSLDSGVRLFINDGNGTFTERTDSGFARNTPATTLALADVDGNGTLDLYVANYRATTFKDSPPELRGLSKTAEGMAKLDKRFGMITNAAGQPILFELGEPDALYLNDGKGHFKQVSWTGGNFLDESGQAVKEPPQDWGLSASFRDLNGDGLPDLYVCNDFLNSPDRIWINQGRGVFKAASTRLIRHTPLSSMAMDSADINRDGRVDFLVVDMLGRTHSRRMTQRGNLEFDPLPSPPGAITNRPQYTRNSLFLGRADGTFAEVASMAGIAATDWSWSAAFMDVDLDGYEDLLITTGNAHDLLDSDVTSRLMTGGLPRSARPPGNTLQFYPKLETPLLAYRNLGGTRFEETGAAWGFNAPGIAQGMAFADLDNDGDLDVVINCLNGPARIYRNDSPRLRVAVRLKGPVGNTRGIGAKITVQGYGFMQSQEMISGGRYLSGDDAVRVFAAGESMAQTIRVQWPGGLSTTVTNIAPNHYYEITASESLKPTSAPREKPPVPLFVDDSALLNYTHDEALFDDFERQPLLPRHMDQYGPGIAFVDSSASDFPSVLIAGGTGQKPVFFRNRGGKAFDRQELDPGFEPVPKQNAALVIPGLANELLIFLTLSNYETGGKTVPSLISFKVSAGDPRPSGTLPAQTPMPGAMAVADLDQDGMPELFVGSRLIPGRYPEAGESRIYRCTPTGLKLDLRLSRAVAGAGLVSGAVFTDLNGDGWPDLVLACEWGPVRIYINHHGELVDATDSWQMTGMTGWWNGITAGDFDGDGRMDLAVSNWGRNTSDEPYRSKPLTLYFGEFAGDGRMHPIEAGFDPDSGREVPLRDLDALSRAMPFVTRQFPSYAEFSISALSKLLDAASTNKSGILRAARLETTIFLNRGDHFEIKPLPAEAQFSPAFGITVADFNGDGFEDLFLAQNFFATRAETPRMDAGRGLLLIGKGDGTFKAASSLESGITMDGEQRASAVGDFNGDGRPDLVITQNGGPAVLLRNQSGRPEIRITLKSRTPGGTIGAKMRMTTGNSSGPTREIHAGSGHWSQDSLVQLMAPPPGGIGTLVISWPSGRTSQYPITAATKSIEASEPAP